MYLQPQKPMVYRRYPMMVRTRGLSGGDATEAEISSTLPAIGSAVGGPIGSAIGSVVGAITSLFGGKVHNTAGGETYKVAQSTFYTNQAQIETLYKQLAATTGIVPPTFPPTPANHDGTQNIQWVSQLIGMYLNDPSLATSNSDTLNGYKTNGTYDRALQAQAAVLQWLQGETSSSTGGLPVALVPTAPASSTPSTTTSMVPDISSVDGVIAPATTTADYSYLLLIGAAFLGAYLFVGD